MRLGVALVAAWLVVPQGRQENDSVANEITALIDKTNVLESFHAFYDLVETEHEGHETGKNTLELIYRAPDLGRLRASGSAGDHDYWVTTERIYVHEGETWRTATIESVPAANVLYERFPESAVESGVCVVMNMSKSASGEGGVQLAFMGAPWNRPCVLGWLEMLRHRTGVTVRDSSLEWDDGGLRCRVSRETGLLEEASSESDEGRMQLRLREGQIDCKLASELVDLPDAARNARVDAELTRRFAFNRNSWRRLAFLHVESQAESGKRDWSELARNDWHEVMDALHRQAIAKSYAKTLSDLRTQIETVSELAREDAEKDKSEENRAEVQKKVAEQRAKMEEALTGLRTSYVDSLPAIEPERHEPRQDLFDTEKEVIDDLWKELILDPLLAYFDEKFAEALGK